MDNELTLLFVFAVQGILLDILFGLALLFSVLFLLFKWVNYLLRAQKERTEQKASRNSIETQVDLLLRDIEGL